MFHAVVFAIYVYVLSRLVLPLPWPLGWKLLAALILLPLTQYHLILRGAFGSLASPEIPFAALAALGGAFGAFILLAAFLLLKDVAALCLWGMHQAGLVAAVRLSTPGWSAGLCLAATLLAAVGVWQATRVPGVREVEVTLENLPPAMDGLTVAQLTDLHISRLFPAAWTRAVVARANALSPDLILITGDLIDGTVAARAQAVEPLRDLRAPLGVVAISGNHEYYSGHAAWMDKFRELGLRVLNNEHIAISRGDASLYVAGLTDTAAARFGDPLPDLRRALADIPPGATTILMAHRPGAAATAAAAGVALQLSGHTHGGQILGLDRITKAANGGFVSGLYRVGAMQLYVSNGTGLWNGLPIRLGVPPEITRIVLRAPRSFSTPLPPGGTRGSSRPVL